MGKTRNKPSDLEPEEIELTPVEKADESEYFLTVYMNNEVFTCATNDLFNALKSLAPKVFKTKVVIKVSNPFSTVERVLMIQRAKMLFRSNMNMEVFVKNILLGLKKS